MDPKAIETKNYYELLGVTPDAPPEKIREVYKELARVYHPDSNFYDEIVPGKASNDQVHIFKVITAAYNTLTDEAKRREYDEKIRPLMNISKNFKAWEDPTDDFQILRSTDEISQRNGTAARARRMTGVFGRQDLVNDDEPEPEVTAERPIFGSPPPRITEAPSMIVLIIAGLVVGSLVGGSIFYLIWSRTH